MEKLPKHKKVKLTNLYGEEMEATIIPLSIKGSMDVEDYLEELRNNLQDKADDKKNRYKQLLDKENPDDETLLDNYVESKVTMDLTKLNEEITDERVKSLKEKRFKKLTEGKTREVIINEMAEILYDLDVRKQILVRTVSRTLWNVLRDSKNLRINLFETVDDLEESLDTDTLIDIFKDVDENKVEEEDLKN